MKNSFLKFSLFACIALFSVACSRSEKLVGNEFLIEGNISDVEDGAVISLYRINDNFSGKGRSDVATDTVKNGRFKFKSKVVLNPDWLIIGAQGEGFMQFRFLTVWAAPRTKIKIKGNGKIPELWEVKSSVPNQKEENRYEEKSCDIIAEEARLHIERYNLFTKRRVAASEEEALAYSKSIDSISVLIRLLEEKELFNYVAIMEQTKISDVWLNKMQKIINELFYASNLSFPTTYLEQADELRKKAEALYGKLSETDKNTPIGAHITTLLTPRIVKIGDDMPDTNLFYEDGNTKRISDYLGKYLLLDFWAHSCGACILAIPEMREISEIYRNNLTIISISHDNDAVWKETMTKYDMPWIHIRDPKGMSGLAANYGAAGIPNYVIISPEGKVVDKWAGYVEGLLKNKIKENIK